MPGLGPHTAENSWFLGSPSPQVSQAPFMDMAISALQTGWTLMDHVSSVRDCKALPSPTLLWFKIFPLKFYISSPARCIFSLTWVRVCPKAASPPPVSSSLSLLAVNKISLSKASVAEEPQEYSFLVLSLFWCADYPLVASIAHLLLEVF